MSKMDRDRAIRDRLIDLIIRAPTDGADVVADRILAEFEVDWDAEHDRDVGIVEGDRVSWHSTPWVVCRGIVEIVEDEIARVADDDGFITLVETDRLALLPDNLGGGDD